MTSAVVYTPPDIPSKWDIIPIHASDISAFKRCRRYWNWSSPTRTNLRKKVQIHGISFPLWFGSGIHYALEMYYHPLLKRDPVESFITWYTYQWEGGIVDEDWLERTYDPEPVLIPGKKVGEESYPDLHTKDLYEPDTWKIRGLRDLHPSPDLSEFDRHRELGIGMMTYYRDHYAPKYDTFEVIAAESQFSVPLGFEWVDQREDSPNYGKKLEVHARGKRDMVIRDLESGQYGVKDHKTKSEITENYFVSLEKDEQVTNYMWASQEEAHLYDLPYKKIDFCIHQALRKVFPKPPTPLKNGTPSLSRSTESTTPELYRDYIVQHGLVEWHDDNPKAQAYYNYLVDKGDENFIVRTLVYRNKHELENQGKHIRAIAREMLDSPAIYPHPTGDYLCVNCAFRAPCIAADDGSDEVYMLNTAYESNLDR